MHAEELVTPGTRKEMEEFEQYTVSRSRIAVTCTVPSLRVHLPGKEFLEILFNRCVMCDVLCVMCVCVCV